MEILPTLRARVRRRVLISVRLDADAAEGLIPEPFRPQLVDGSAVIGICVIGTSALRPGWVRPEIGLRSENAAHRLAVEWDDAEVRRTGVYVTERHSSSWLPAAAGGRLFPGVQTRARFDVRDTDRRHAVRMTAPGTSFDFDVEEIAPADWSSDLFPDVAAASRFHEEGRTGWSPRADGTGSEPIELTSTQWSVRPARVVSLHSTWLDAFGDAATLDSALVMRDLPFRWRVPA